MLASVVIEPYCVPHLFSHLAWSFVGYSVSHTDCSHSTRLGYDHSYFLNWFDNTFDVLLNLFLVVFDWLEYCFGVHHVLGQLGRFTRTSIACHNTEVIFWDSFFDFLLIVMNRQSLLELSYLLFLHFLYLYLLLKRTFNFDYKALNQRFTKLL